MQGAVNMKLYVLLPSYNEEESLPFLLDSLYKLVKNRYENYEIVVINDGSKDNTEAVALQWSDKMNLKVINHDKNMGLGEAVNTGMSYFFRYCNDDDVAVIMDADNTHNPELIPLMIDKSENSADVVIASRYQKGGSEIGLSFLRKLCSLCASLILSFFYNIPGVKDYTCGYRLYKGRAIKKAFEVFGNNFIEEKGFTCMAEIIIKLHYIGCEIREIPLRLRYDLKKGRSKMKILQTIKSYFILIHKSKHFRQYLTVAPVLADGKDE